MPDACDPRLGLEGSLPDACDPCLGLEGSLPDACDPRLGVQVEPEMHKRDIDELPSLFQMKVADACDPPFLSAGDGGDALARWESALSQAKQDVEKCTEEVSMSLT